MPPKSKKTGIRNVDIAGAYKLDKANMAQDKATQVICSWMYAALDMMSLLCVRNRLTSAAVDPVFVLTVARP